MLILPYISVFFSSLIPSSPFTQLFIEVPVSRIIIRTFKFNEDPLLLIKR